MIPHDGVPMMAKMLVVGKRVSSTMTIQGGSQIVKGLLQKNVGMTWPRALKTCVVLLAILDNKHLEGGMFGQGVSTFLHMNPCFRLCVDQHPSKHQLFILYMECNSMSCYFDYPN